jgi:hypothetical protein
MKEERETKKATSLPSTPTAAAPSAPEPKPEPVGVDVPNDLLGLYAGPENRRHKLTIGPMGMKSSGIHCNYNLAFSSFQSAGANKWKFTTDGDTHGIMAKVGDDLNISVGGFRGSQCIVDGLTGMFSKTTH